MIKYDSYLDSGFQWLGQVPSHWRILPGRALFKENREKNDGEDRAILSLSYGKIVVKKNMNEGLVPDDYTSYQIIKPGYIIVRCTDLQNDKVSLRTAISEYEGIITGAYIGLIPNEYLNPRYCHYLLRTWDNTKELYRYGSGLRQSLSWADFKYLSLAIPPRNEQDAIASYLDAATAKIDEAIAQQHRMIELLNERKRIIINHTVSKGLDPNAKLKDSGIDWMGQIPEHWQVCRIKAVGKSEHGISYTPSDMTDESGTIVLRASNIRDGKLCFDDNVYVKRARATKLLKKNDILICATNGSLSLVGKNALIDKSDCYSFGTFMLALRTSQNQNFIRYQLGRVVENYRGLFATTTINQITQQVLGDIRVTIPPLKEQARIAVYLDDITSKIDNAIFQQTSIINLLQERKQIIINDVVTGKVKVV